jgi:putative phosphoesterase
MTRPPREKEFVIGVVADTHGALSNAAAKALEGSDAIVHAGDVGPGYVLETLEAIAPVTLVRGSNSCVAEGRAPIVVNVKLGGIRVMAAHLESDLTGAADPALAGARVAIFGHTHLAEITECDGVLWVNPGSPTQPRQGSAKSVALVTIAVDGSVSARIVEV